MTDRRAADERREPAAQAPTLTLAEALEGVPRHGLDAVFNLVLARGKGAPADVKAAAVDLEELAPKDAAEARLAALFVASADAAAREFGRAAVTTLAQHHRDALAMADRLSRTAVLLAEAIKRRRRPAEQRIVVEQRVTVPDGGRTVVGLAVQAQGGGGDGREIEHQSHAPCLAHEPGAALPRAIEAERAAVPCSGGEGSGGLPDARRAGRGAGGRAERAVRARPAQRRGAGGAHDEPAAAAGGQGRAGGPVGG